MSDLRLPMHELTFDQLVDLGRAVIPATAKGWTDHNIHDPGIMLMELVAWIADAQMYSLSRLRRDERFAYARLLGETPTGPQPAEGFVWPFASETTKEAPLPAWAEGTLVEAGRAVTTDRADAPRIFTSAPVALTTARMSRVETFAGAQPVHDWTTANARDGATFLPFGSVPRSGDRLVLTFQVPPDGVGKVTGPLSIGVEIINEGRAPAGAPARTARRLVAAIEETDSSRPLEIEQDSTNGLLTSGVLQLNLSGSEPRGATFAISIGSATGGFVRSPRVQRIAVNVLSVVQQESIVEAAELPGGMPHHVYELGHAGLMFPFEPGSFKVEVAEQGAFRTWAETGDLERSGPDDRHFSLDRRNGQLTFGNGVNGFIPRTNAALSVSYQVCDGLRGNLPRNTRWRLAGVLGEFGVNSEALRGGCNAVGLPDLGTRVRRRSRTVRPLVTKVDLEQAALSFTDFGVNRARELSGSPECPVVRGLRRLIVLSRQDADADAPLEAEPREFLDAVRARLAPRLPAGQRLDVIGPRYIPVRITARLIVARKADPATVRQRAIDELRTKLRLTATGDGAEWPFERNLTRLMVAGWLRSVEDVSRVSDVVLLAGTAGTATENVEIEGRQLPQLQLDPNDVVVERQSAAGAR